MEMDGIAGPAAESVQILLIIMQQLTYTYR